MTISFVRSALIKRNLLFPRDKILYEFVKAVITKGSWSFSQNIKVEINDPKFITPLSAMAYCPE